MIKTLCEQFLFSNRVAFHSRYQIPGSLDTEISFKNLETGMILKMALSGVIPKQSTDAIDLIPVLGCVSSVCLYKEEIMIEGWVTINIIDYNELVLKAKLAEINIVRKDNEISVSFQSLENEVDRIIKDKYPKAESNYSNALSTRYTIKDSNE